MVEEGPVRSGAKKVDNIEICGQNEALARKTARRVYGKRRFKVRFETVVDYEAIMEQKQALFRHMLSQDDDDDSNKAPIKRLKAFSDEHEEEEKDDEGYLSP